MTIIQQVNDIEELQADVTAGEIALARQNEIAFRLWQGGTTQREIAELLDRVDRDSGGTGVSLAKIQKRLARMRAEREDELLVAASSS